VFGEALVAGHVDRAIGSFSPELKRNVGEVIALLPLPATAGFGPPADALRPIPTGRPRLS
jgi:hypothetical protein